ncbi:MAG: thiamine pyrophosphate-dependent dehydrogenase E1 component subunit alpha [Planctomycetota bacterium]
MSRAPRLRLTDPPDSLSGSSADALGLAPERCLQLHQNMVRSRVMEERLIKMSKSGEGYFWIGGPGEEAFNSCLGLQVKKGCGPQYDYLHLKYRASAVVLAMGVPILDCVRQMAMTATDPFSMGRSFVAHYASKDMNIVPVSSVIGVQFAIAPGTALVQKRLGGDGVSIVVGGESGTAEGDFASGMLWSTRPGFEAPLLIIVMNNGWGISTPQCSVQSCADVIDRGKAFGIPGEIVDGNDPIASWHTLERAMNYCRTHRRPYMVEAKVSRLHGHSSSSGAPRSSEPDCIEMFEKKLTDQGLLNAESLAKVHADAKAEVDDAAATAVREPKPRVQDIERFTYAPSRVDAVYPDDFTGLPRMNS